MQQELAPPAHFLNYPVFCAKLHAFKLFSQIVSTLSTKDNRTIEGRIELLKMALSMNITTNRSKDRIDLLFSLLGVSDTKDIEFIENTITNITSPITDNNIAGIIDGDGSFLLSKKGYASIEFTVDIRDEHALHIIKNVYGGSIKLRSGANSIRYRLHHKSGLLSLINDVNGLIRNSNRLIQLNKICQKYELNLILPENLTYYNGWLSGIFVSEGCISINKTNTQLSISVSQKTSELLKPLVDLYKGNIYIDNGSLKSFKWYITKREDILSLVEYFKKHPSRSAKKNRLHLIPKYYELKDLKAHKALPDTLLHKSWLKFYSK